MQRFSPVMSLGVAMLLAVVVLVLWIGGTRAPLLEEPPHAATFVGTAATTAAPAIAIEPASKEPDSPQIDSPDTRPGSPLAAELNAATSDAAHDVETLHALLRQYLRHLQRRQGLPIGNDADLARVLTGHNPMKLVVIPRNHRAISPDGHLRDRWGTPYFIHPRGNNAFEIRSAGPDRQLFTSDDVVENPLQKEANSEE